VTLEAPRLHKPKTSLFSRDSPGSDGSPVSRRKSPVFGSSPQLQAIRLDVRLIDLGRASQPLSPSKVERDRSVLAFIRAVIESARAELSHQGKELPEHPSRYVSCLPASLSWPLLTSTALPAATTRSPLNTLTTQI
jgi:hypothetical protein